MGRAARNIIYKKLKKPKYVAEVAARYKGKAAKKTKAK